MSPELSSVGSLLERPELEARRLPPEEPGPARIRTLGSFALLRGGQHVPLGEWKSRKARDPLKILVARRGRAAPREYERGHIELVSTLAEAGRHGEVRRCYAAHAVRMDEIGIEAAPYPAPAGSARS